MTRHVHLAGSLSLASAHDCFCTVSTLLGPKVTRLPDGETGERGSWIGWQAGKLAANSALIAENKNVSGNSRGGYGSRTKFVLRNGIDPEDISFEELGYTKEALASYEVFARLRHEGVISQGVRFQVSLPTPTAVMTAFVAEESQRLIEPALEQGFLNEIFRITSAIPAEDLAIQWDVAVEFGILEVGMPFFAENKLEAIIDRLVRLGEAVPPGVLLGYHLCYGNMGLKHFKEPEDSSLLVKVANLILATIARNIDWVHLPVPIDRCDEAYFAPLRELDLPEASDLFLGLIHLEDGLAGTQRRIEAAEQFISCFGIAAECGLSNRSEEWTRQMLALHSAAADL